MPQVLIGCGYLLLGSGGGISLTTDSTCKVVLLQSYYFSHIFDSQFYLWKGGDNFCLVKLLRGLSNQMYRWQPVSKIVAEAESKELSTTFLQSRNVIIFTCEISFLNFASIFIKYEMCEVSIGTREEPTVQNASKIQQVFY